MFAFDLHVSYFSFYKTQPSSQHLKKKKKNRYANATLNQPCIIENTTYVNDLHTGDPSGDGEAIFTMNVIKHNCRFPNLFFCDPPPEAAAAAAAAEAATDVVAGICQPTKELKQNCRFDAECASVRFLFFFFGKIVSVC